jgi:hypothetical protein
MTKNGTIFISVASYRDPELIPTVQHCIKQAKYPENLRFGICWQKDDTEDISSILSDNMKVYDCDWRESRGACWSRHVIQKNLFNNEDYYLQLDSHHRFLPNWDQELFDLMEYAKGFSDKPLIGTYGTTYWPNQKDDELHNVCYKINTFDKFGDDGDLISRPNPISNITDKLPLITARLLSGHFIFGENSFVHDCMYDPNFYFRGEELVLSARAYTHGYDMYHPTKPIIWHEYLRADKHKHWSDHIKSNGILVEGEDRNIRSKERQRKLFGIERNDINFGKYALGKSRSLHDYELYAGIDFKNRRVHKYCFNVRNDSPEPHIMTEDEWNSGMLNKYEIDIEWDLSLIPADNDFDFWFVGFESKQGQLIYRDDFKSDNEQHQKFLKKQINTCKFTFGAESKPHRYVIIPHSISGGWRNRISAEC